MTEPAGAADPSLTVARPPGISPLPATYSQVDTLAAIFS